MYNIIGDVAGRYDELMLLLAKMPKGEVILLGDLNDRGPKSNQVIQWAIDNKIRCVKSNHGDMLINHFNHHMQTDYDVIRNHKIDPDYHPYNHFSNGGHATLESYGGIDKVPVEHVLYLEGLPWYIQENGLFLSHAPWNPNYDKLKDVMREEHRAVSLLWNREHPKRRDVYQIHGHNTFHITYKDNQGDYGMCVDDCGNNQLMGIHWPTKEIFTQEYIV